jgi:hypothetical protein
LLSLYKTKDMRIFLCLIVSLMLTSCGTMYVDYDYDTKKDIAGYKNYDYDFSEPSGLSEFDERRFLKYTDSILQSRGFVKTLENDIFIKIKADEFETNSRNTIGVGLGGGGGNVGVGVSGGIPIGGAERHLQLVFTIYEAQNAQATLWEATSESDVKVKASPEKKEAHFKKLAEKILSKYPPQK